MILRPYGSTVSSVEPNFDSRAMTEVGFRRTAELSLPAAEFEAMYEQVSEHELTATAEGSVKDDAEREMLDSLLERLRGLESGAAEGEVLLIANRPGHDYPKTRDRTRNVVVEGENRLHFAWTIDPPLKVLVYRRREG